MADKKITIAIDGYSSCGKSTLAKQLAEKLNYTFIDSGAMYRAVTLYSINHELITNNEVNEVALIEKLPEISISFRINPETGQNEINLNNEFVEGEIRKPNVASFVSKIARIKEVRQKLVETQREIGKDGGIVMDGRDIGSVVFPNAELKIFVTASTEVRVERRYKELFEKGIETTKSAVKDNLVQRDLIDTTRKESPLIQVEDAKVIDNTNLTREQQLSLALEYAEELIKNHSIQ